MRSQRLLLAFMLALALSPAAWGGITEVGTAQTAAQSGASTLTVDKPTGVVAGNVMWVAITSDGPAGGSAPPASPTLSGWTNVADKTLHSTADNAYNRLTVLRRIADGTEGSSFVFHVDGTCYADCWIDSVCWRGRK
jgi:hypothetical protein